MIILRNQNKMDEYKLRLHNGRERDCGWRKVCYNNLTNLQGIKDSKSFGEHWPSNRAHAFGSRLNSFKRVVKFQALKLEALEKCLSAQNASCRDAAAPFSKRVFVHIGIITSRILSFGEHWLSNRAYAFGSRLDNLTKHESHRFCVFQKTLNH